MKIKTNPTKVVLDMIQKMTFNKMIAISLFIAMVFMLSNCNNHDSNPLTKREDGIDYFDQVFKVRVQRVDHAAIRDVVKTSGGFIASKDITISAQVPGEVAEIPVEEGDEVNQGDLLVRLDDTELRLAAKQANSQLQQARYNLENARKDFERKKELLDKKVISEQVFDAIKTQYEIAKAGFEAAQAASALAEKKVADASIRSPIEGFVTARFIEVGEYVAPGVPVFEVKCIKPIKLRASMVEKYFTRVRKGQKVHATVSAYPDKIFTGSIILINPAIDPETRTFTIEALFDNEDGLLKHGFFASTEVILSEKQDVLAVPQDCIIDVEGSRKVFVVQDDHALAKEVVTGARYNGNVEILSGLTRGELLITEGQFVLKDGNKVQIVNNSNL